MGSNKADYGYPPGGSRFLKKQLYRSRFLKAYRNVETCLLNRK